MAHTCKGILPPRVDLQFFVFIGAAWPFAEHENVARVSRVIIVPFVYTAAYSTVGVVPSMVGRVPSTVGTLAWE